MAAAEVRPGATGAAAGSADLTSFFLTLVVFLVVPAVFFTGVATFFAGEAAFFTVGAFFLAHERCAQKREVSAV